MRLRNSNPIGIPINLAAFIVFIILNDLLGLAVEDLLVSCGDDSASATAEPA